MRKRGLAISILLVIVLCTVVLFGCNDASWGNYYNSDVTSLYGDGIKIAQSYDAPASATEYIGSQRVEQEQAFDPRISGIHPTGLYLPKGESIIVSLSQQVSTTINIHINYNGENGQVFTLDGTQGEFYSENGGIVGISSDSPSDFIITFKGAAISQIFRYGVDTSLRKGVGNTAVIDCENVAIYLPTSYISAESDLTRVMGWWRNAFKIIDKVVKLNGGDKLSLYIGDYSRLTTDISKRTIYVPLEFAGCASDYSSLTDGYALDILKCVSQIKLNQSNLFNNKFANDEMDYILSGLCAVYAVDLGSDYIRQRDDGWLFNNYESAYHILKGEINDSQRKIAYMLNIAFAFGADALSDCLVKLAESEAVDISEMQASVAQENMLMQFYDIVTEYLDRDISAFTNKSLNVEIQQNDKDDFILVANRYTYGQYERGNGQSVVVPMGVARNFDFEENFVSFGDDVEIISINGRKNAWLENGYTPDTAYLKDAFNLLVKVGETEITLFGNISVNVHVSTNRIYDDVAYRSIDQAVKKYKSDYSSPSSVQSTDFATCDNGTASIFGNTYSFALSEGCVEVNETGKYYLYLKNKGIVRVDFGVPQFTSTIFSNSLTVNAFTDELKYEISLEKGVSYYYTIYLLTTSGDGSAELALRKVSDSTPPEQLSPISEDNLFYKGVESGHLNYYTPEIISNSQIVKEEFCYPRDTSQWNIINYPYGNFEGNRHSLFDGDMKTRFVSQSENENHIFEIDMGAEVECEYVGFYILPVAGNYKVSIKNANGEYIELISGSISDIKSVGTDTIYKRLEARLVDAIAFRYIKVEFSQLEGELCIYEIDAGRIFKESTLVPNTDEGFKFEGDWVRDSSYIAVNGCITKSASKNARVTYKFYGSAVAIYCTVGEEFGEMTLLIDDKQFVVIDLKSQNRQSGKMMFCFDFLSDGEHSITLVARNRVAINFDYLAVKFGQKEDAVADYSRLWLISIIPAVLIIAMIVCISLDIVKKKNEKKLSITFDESEGKQSDEGLFTPPTEQEKKPKRKKKE